MTASAIMDSPINAWNDHWKSGSQFENSLQTQQGWKRRTEYRESIARKTFGPSYAYDNLKQRRITQK